MKIYIIIDVTKKGINSIHKIFTAQVPAFDYIKEVRSDNSELHKYLQLHGFETEKRMRK